MSESPDIRLTRLPLANNSGQLPLIVEDLAIAVAEAGAVHASAIPLGQLVKKESGPLRACRTIFSSTGHAFLDVITTAHLLRALEGSGERRKT